MCREKRNREKNADSGHIAARYGFGRGLAETVRGKLKNALCGDVCVEAGKLYIEIMRKLDLPPRFGLAEIVAIVGLVCVGRNRSR